MKYGSKVTHLVLQSHSCAAVDAGELHHPPVPKECKRARDARTGQHPASASKPTPVTTMSAAMPMPGGAFVCVVKRAFAGRRSTVARLRNALFVCGCYRLAPRLSETTRLCPGEGLQAGAEAAATVNAGAAPMSCLLWQHRPHFTSFQDPINFK
jgi:hypothetical protein